MIFLRPPKTLPDLAAVCRTGAVEIKGWASEGQKKPPERHQGIEDRGWGQHGESEKLGSDARQSKQNRLTGSTRHLLRNLGHAAVHVQRPTRRSAEVFGPGRPSAPRARCCGCLPGARCRGGRRAGYRSDVGPNARIERQLANAVKPSKIATKNWTRQTCKQTPKTPIKLNTG